MHRPLFLMLYHLLTALPLMGQNSELFAFQLDAKTLDKSLGQTAPLEVAIFADPEGHQLLLELQGKLTWAGDQPLLLLNTDAHELSGHAQMWLGIYEEERLRTPLTPFVPAEHKLTFTADGTIQGLSQGLQGLSASYVAQAANFLAGNVTDFDLKAGRYMLRDAGTGNYVQFGQYDFFTGTLQVGEERTTGTPTTSITLGKGQAVKVIAPIVTLLNSSSNGMVTRLSVSNGSPVTVSNGLSSVNGVFSATDNPSGNDYDPANYVAHIKNTNSSSDADLLALQIETSTPGANNNFVTFFASQNAAVGAIQGSGNGGVTYKSGNADFAEYLPRLQPEEVLEAGDVVGLFGNQVSRQTQGADRVMAISTAPLVLGNDPGKENEASYLKIAMLGQVPVKVEGLVNKGDFIVASGKNDGMGKAVVPTQLTLAQLDEIVGLAWEDKQDRRQGVVLTAIGLHETLPLIHSISQLQAQLQDQETRISTLEKLVSRSMNH